MDVQKILSGVLLLFLVNAVMASSGASSLCTAMASFCDLLVAVLPIMGFVLFVLAGVSYAAGNFFGAETRAKAQGWAMNMITGAIIAFVLWALGPILINALAPAGASSFSVGKCDFTC